MTMSGIVRSALEDARQGVMPDILTFGDADFRHFCGQLRYVGDSIPAHVRALLWNAVCRRVLGTMEPRLRAQVVASPLHSTPTSAEPVVAMARALLALVADGIGQPPLRRHPRQPQSTWVVRPGWHGRLERRVQSLVGAAQDAAGYGWLEDLTLDVRLGHWGCLSRHVSRPDGRLMVTVAYDWLSQVARRRLYECPIAFDAFISGVADVVDERSGIWSAAARWVTRSSKWTADGFIAWSCEPGLIRPGRARSIEVIARGRTRTSALAAWRKAYADLHSSGAPTPQERQWNWVPPVPYEPAPRPYDTATWLEDIEALALVDVLRP